MNRLVYLEEMVHFSFCFYYYANVPSDLSLLASGMAPAREAESAGAMPEVPKGQGLGRLACSDYF